MILVHQVSAGGAAPVEWSNDGIVTGNAGPLYTDVTGATLLSGGNANVAGDGCRIDLIALQGGTNYLLASATIGDVPGALAPFADGFFELASAVPSNVLAGAVGAPLGVRFFNAPSIGAATKFGIVSNSAIVVPSPDWVTPPPPLTFALDPSDSTYRGPRTAGETGFYPDTDLGGAFSNNNPVAICRSVTVSANANCQAIVTANQVNNGSYDSDGDPITGTLNPPGPFPLGTNATTLIVADDRGGTNTCAGTVIVRDITAPGIVCPANVAVAIPAGQTFATVNFSAPVASDNCSLQSVTVDPPSGSSFPLGETPVLCTVVDAANLTNTCIFTVTVSSLPSTNAVDRLVVLQEEISTLRQCLGEVGLRLLAQDQAGAVAQFNGCIALANDLVASAQSPATSTALGAKTAGKLAKKIAAWAKKLNVPLPADNAKALKALLKHTGTGLKVESLFLKLGNFYPYLVLTETKGKTGFHLPDTIVCYKVTAFTGNGLTNCNPVTISIENFPESVGLNIIQGPAVYSNRVELCVTTGPDQGGAVITATGCQQSSRVVLINTGK
ncbi:MAG: hypothetical protein PCFJNLEI_04074 [Verrucomicrobiae bacterium]|nr:hypothetical protein [Verrucomicrobiae bacterium]